VEPTGLLRAVGGLRGGLFRYVVQYIVEYVVEDSADSKAYRRDRRMGTHCPVPFGEELGCLGWIVIGDRDRDLHWDPTR
jgi:hypothetical protein